MNFKKILPITILLGALITLLFFISHYSLEKDIKASLEIQRESQQILQDFIKRKISYTINKGDGEILRYQIIPDFEDTVFSLLEKLSKKENFELSYKEYPGMGILVESIDEVKNGTDGKYWQYWVNNELPMVAADKMQVQGGDIVEWKFESPEF